MPDFRRPDDERSVMSPPPGPSPWDELILRARDSLWEAETILGDDEADRVAKAAAKKLADGQLRNGHLRAIKAHIRALTDGLGADVTAEYLDEFLWRLTNQSE